MVFCFINCLSYCQALKCHRRDVWTSFWTVNMRHVDTWTGWRCPGECGRAWFAFENGADPNLAIMFPCVLENGQQELKPWLAKESRKPQLPGCPPRVYDCNLSAQTLKNSLSLPLTANPVPSLHACGEFSQNACHLLVDLALGSKD